MDEVKQELVYDPMTGEKMIVNVDEVNEIINRMPDISADQKAEIDKAVDRIIDERKVKRVGSQVFCVSCGAKKKQLYKWYNSYICCDCRKTLLKIGEENFMKILRGEEDGD